MCRDPQTTASEADRALSGNIPAPCDADGPTKLSRHPDAVPVSRCTDYITGGNLHPPVHSPVFILFLRRVEWSSEHLSTHGTAHHCSRKTPSFIPFPLKSVSPLPGPPRPRRVHSGILYQCTSCRYIALNVVLLMNTCLPYTNGAAW